MERREFLKLFGALGALPLLGALPRPKRLTAPPVTEVVQVQDSLAVFLPPGDHTYMWYPKGKPRPPGWNVVTDRGSINDLSNSLVLVKRGT